MNRRSSTVGVSVLLALAVALALLGSAPAPAQARPVAAPMTDGIAPVDQAGIDRLVAETGATVDVSPATGAVRFVSLTPAQVDRLARVLGTSGTAEGQAAAFFARYGSIFGIADHASELSLLPAKTDVYGYTHLSYQQVYQGVPVFAAYVRVHLDGQLRITAVNGTFIPAPAVDATPRLAAAAAEGVALDAVASGNNAPGALAAQRTTLYVYRAGLAQGVPGPNYLAYEVVVGNNQDVREFVYVDAHKGSVVDQVTGVYDITRRLYNGSYTPANLVWQEGDPFPTGNAEYDHVLSATKDTYDLVAHASSGTYLSYDGTDGVMLAIANTTLLSCPNAQWTGTYTHFCTNVSGDDTVAHEWGHAYTEYTHNLIYAWQPGALNESYSDIFGEVTDMVNGANQPDVHRTDGACSQYATPPGTDNSYRWLSGEDDPAFGGAIRDLWLPTCFGDPAKVSDTQYVCSSSDNGGVHTNCGVPSHAFALATDGGTYNSQVIAGIGMTKTFAIYWRAESLYQVPTTDFEDHANALDQACTDLVGQNLPSLYTGLPSGVSITSGDCAELAKAELAVQLRTAPTQCNFQPLLNPNTPAWCGAGESPVVLWRDTLETDPATTWTLSNTGVFTTYTPRDWEWDHTLPGGRSGAAFFGLDSLTLGDCDPASDDQSGVMHADSPTFVIPAGVTAPILSFDHYVATENRWDGGNVNYRVNGGAWTLVPRTTFTFNQYNQTLQSVGAGNTNPLAGQYAFTGSDGGQVTGSWGTSRVNLSTLVTAGQNLQLRFSLGVDGCNGLDGWYVDNVVVYACSATPTAVDVTAVASSTPAAPLWLGALLALGAVVALALARKR